MAFPQQKQDDILDIAQQDGSEAVLKDLSVRFYPEKQNAILELSTADGADAVLEGLLEQMLEDGFLGQPEITPTAEQEAQPPVSPVAEPPVFGPERPAALPEVRLSEQPQALGRTERDSVPQLPTEGAGPIQQLSALEDFEVLGRAQFAEDIGFVFRHRKNIPAAMKLFGKVITKLPKQTAAKLIMASQGAKGASVVSPGPADRLVISAGKNIDEFVSETEKLYKGRKILPGVPLTEIARLAENLPFSIASLGVGVAAGAPIAFTPIPGARPAALAIGVLATGSMAKEMASYQIMLEYLQWKNEERLGQTGKPLTQADEDRLKKEFMTTANRVGLWEAVPEMVGTAIGAGAILAPLKKIVGRSVALRITGRVAAVYGGQIGEETVTEMLQAHELAKAEFPGAVDVDFTDPKDWLAAMKRIAPGTFLLTTITAGPAATAVAATRAAQGRQIKQAAQIVEQALLDELTEDIGTDHAQFEQFAEKLVEVANQEQQVTDALIGLESVTPEQIEAGIIQIPSLRVQERVGIVGSGAQGSVIDIADGRVNVQMDNGFRVNLRENQVFRLGRPPLETGPVTEIETGERETPPLPAEVGPVIVETDKEAVQEILNQRDAVPDEDVLQTIATTTGNVVEVNDLLKRHDASAVLDEMQSQIVAPEPPQTQLEAWTKQESDKLNAQLEEEGQVGAINLSRKEAAPLPEDPAVQQVLENGVKKSGSLKQMRGWVADKTRTAIDFAAAEFEPELKRGGFFQFRDDVRTGYIPILPKARQQWVTAKGIIYGIITKDQKKSLMALLALRDMEFDLNNGLPLPRDLHQEFVTLASGDVLPTVTVERVKLENKLAQSDPEVLEAAERYRDYALLVGEDLVRRGKISEEALRTDYFPHMVKDFLPDWWDLAPFAQKIAKDPFRKYTIERKGTARDVVFDERALDVHFTSVAADNMMEDWGKSQMEKWDILPKLTKDEKNTLLRGARKAKHGMPYEFNGEPFRGIQFARTTARWGHEANLDLLEQALEDAAIDGERLLALPPDQQQAVLRSYLEEVGPRGGDAVRQALILGRNVKTYVVPNPVAQKLLNLREPPALKQLRPVLRLTSNWKGLTLGPFAAGLPFIINQLAGDGMNTYRDSPGALLDVIPAIKIIANADPNNPSWVAKLLPELTPLEEETRKIVIDKDILGSAFFRQAERLNELFGTSPQARALQWSLGTWFKMNSFREAILRVALAHHQLQRVKKGKGVRALSVSGVFPGLDVESQIGVAGREVNVDYLATSQFYRNYMRGMLFPFATFYQKSSANWARYVKNAPVEFATKFIVPYVAAFTWNNEKFPEEEALLPEWMQSRFHIIVNSWDDNGDGFPDRARVWGPQQPLDMALQWTGLNKLQHHIAMLNAGIYESPKEAAREQLRDMGLPPNLESEQFKLISQLINPVIQIIDGIRTNKDSFTRRPIVPRQLEGITAEEKFMSYQAPYAIEKLAVPVGQYMRSTRKDDKIFGSIPKIEDIPSGLQRYVFEGPLALGRGFGIYDVDLNRALARQLTDPTLTVRAIGNQKVYKIQRDYIAFGGTIEDYLITESKQKLVDNALESGIVLASTEAPNTDDYLRTQLKKPWVQLERLGRLKGLAKTEEEKRQIDEAIVQWSYIKAIGIMKTTDKKTWPAWVKRLRRLGEKHPSLKPRETR